MRRLIVDILKDKKSAFRTQGLIQWMRLYSPMEIVGDNVKLNGVNPETGERRAFKCDLANSKPFWTDDKFKEMVKPVFQATILSSVQSMSKRAKAAMLNTVNGQPIDADKPIYLGAYPEKMAEFLSKLDDLLSTMPKDATAEVYKARQAYEEALADAAEMEAKPTAAEGPQEQAA